MSIPTSAQPKPIVAPHASRPLVDSQGKPTPQTAIALQQTRDYVVNMSRRFPCNASTSSNVITLTLLSVQPSLTQYADYDDFGFVADATSTGLLSALVVTANNTFATLNVYKNNGGTQATTNDITAGRQYWLTFTDSLNSGNGGFVLR